MHVAQARENYVVLRIDKPARMTYNMLVGDTADVMGVQDPSGVDAISRGMPKHTRRIYADSEVYWLHGGNHEHQRSSDI
jgi:hypothetical protein